MVRVVFKPDLSSRDQTQSEEFPMHHGEIPAKEYPYLSEETLAETSFWRDIGPIGMHTGANATTQKQEPVDESRLSRTRL